MQIFMDTTTDRILRLHMTHCHAALMAYSFLSKGVDLYRTADLRMSANVSFGLPSIAPWKDTCSPAIKFINLEISPQTPCVPTILKQYVEYAIYLIHFNKLNTHRFDLTFLDLFSAALGSLDHSTFFWHPNRTWFGIVGSSAPWIISYLTPEQQQQHFWTNIPLKSFAFPVTVQQGCVLVVFILSCTIWCVWAKPLDGLNIWMQMTIKITNNNNYSIE